MSSKYLTGKNTFFCGFIAFWGEKRWIYSELRNKTRLVLLDGKKPVFRISKRQNPQLPFGNILSVKNSGRVRRCVSVIDKMRGNR